MKVLIINYRYFLSGGPERYLFNVMDLLENHGHSVIPFSIKSSRNKPTKWESYFAEPIGNQDVVYYREQRKTPRAVIDVIVRLFYSFGVRRKLERLITDTQPDVAYVLHHYNKLSPSIIDACKSKGVPVVMRLSDFFLLCPQAHFLCHGNVCEACLPDRFIECAKRSCIQNSRMGSVLKACAIYLHRSVLRIYDKVDSLVCTTEFMKKQMLKAGFSRNKLQVISTFSASFDIQKKTTWGKEDSPFILYFGRFAQEKGFDLLIQAFAHSELYNEGIRLIGVGGTESDLAYHTFSALEMNITKKHIKLLPFTESNRLHAFVRQSLFCVVPSRWYENLPNTIIEAYGCGKPVIASNLGSLPEFVIDGETGLLFNPGDVNDLSVKLVRLAHDEALRKYMALQIHEFRKIFDPEIHYNSLLKTFSRSISYNNKN